MPTNDAAIVRLIHGDESPAGPGYEEEVDTPVAGSSQVVAGVALRGGVRYFVAGGYDTATAKPAAFPRWLR